MNTALSYSSELEREYELDFQDDNKWIPASQADAVSNEYGEEPEDNFVQRLRDLRHINRETAAGETEVDSSLNKILSDMEREYFFKGLLKKVKKSGKTLLNKGIKIVESNPALRATVGNTPYYQAIKAATQLSTGNLRGLLGSAAKTALGTAFPAATPIMATLGFEAETGEPDWDTFVSIARESYEQLAQNLTEDSDDPIIASEIASRSFKAAHIKHAGGGKDNRRYISVKPGEKVIIVIEGK